MGRCPGVSSGFRHRRRDNGHKGQTEERPGARRPQKLREERSRRALRPPEAQGLTAPQPQDSDQSVEDEPVSF